MGKKKHPPNNVTMSRSLSSAGKSILHSASPLVTESELQLQRKNKYLQIRAADRQHLVTDPWGRVAGKDTAMLDQQIAEKAASDQQKKDAADAEAARQQKIHRMLELDAEAERLRIAAEKDALMAEWRN